MKNKLLIGAVTLGALGTIAATAATSHAFNSEVRDAIENNDYNSWVEAIGDTPRGEEMLSVINEDTFSQLVEANQLRESGDMEGARAIMESLGLDQFMMGKGPGGPDGEGMKGNPEQMQAIKDALDANDYNAWVEAMGDGERAQEILSIINENNFDRLVEAHQLMEQAQAIRNELGLPDFGRHGKQHNNTDNQSDNSQTTAN